MRDKTTSSFRAFVAALSISLLMFGNPALAQISAISLLILENPALAQTPTQTTVCELKVKVDKATGQQAAEFLHIETYNDDPELFPLWTSLFGAHPGTSIDDLLTLQADQPVTWEAGRLTMGGRMKLKVKTDKKDPTLKEIKIEKVGRKDGTTSFVSGTGGVNPSLADGGWHEVKIKDLDNVTATFGTDTVTGFLKELEVKLDQDSTTGNPIVRDFKLKIKAATSIADIKNGIVTSVIVDVPETVVTALADTEYEEKVKDKPEILGGHTEAKYDRADNEEAEGVNIASLVDGANDNLKERNGACTIGVLEVEVCPCFTSFDLLSEFNQISSALTCRITLDHSIIFLDSTPFVPFAYADHSLAPIQFCEYKWDLQRVTTAITPQQQTACAAEIKTTAEVLGCL